MAANAQLYAKTWDSNYAKKRDQLAKLVQIEPVELDQVLDWLNDKLLEFAEGSLVPLAYRSFQRGREDTKLADCGYIVASPVDYWLKALAKEAKLCDDERLVALLGKLVVQKRAYKEAVGLLIEKARISLFKKHGLLRKSEPQMADIAKCHYY